MGMYEEEWADALADQHIADMEEEQREKRQQINNIKIKLLLVKDPSAKEVLRDILNLIERLM
jgi:hypothetical protein